MDTSLNEALNTIYNKLNNWLTSVIDILPNFVLAVLIVIAFVLIGRLARKLVFQISKRTRLHGALRNLLSSLTYIVVLLLGVMIALDILSLDKTVTSILAGIGVIGIALGFAFQDIGANFVSGVIIASRKPYEVGHVIQTGEVFGSVEEINLNMTIIKTWTGQLKMIPNKTIISDVITNYSLTGSRRVDLVAGVSYGDDLEKVKELTEKTIENLPFIMKNQGVAVQFTEFGGSSINLVAKFWIKFPDGEIIYPDAMSEAIIAVKKAYDDNNITIPFPIRTLDFGIIGGEPLSAQLEANGNGTNSHQKTVSEPSSEKD